MSKASQNQFTQNLSFTSGAEQQKKKQQNGTEQETKTPERNRTIEQINNS